MIITKAEMAELTEAKEITTAVKMVISLPASNRYVYIIARQLRLPDSRLLNRSYI